MLSKETRSGFTSAQIVIPLVLTIFFIMLFIYYKNQFFASRPQTINFHLYAAMKMFYGEKFVSHAGYHYSVGFLTELLNIQPEYAGVVILSMVNVATVLIFFLIIRQYSNGSSPVSVSLIFAFMVLLSGPYYFPLDRPDRGWFPHGTIPP